LEGELTSSVNEVLLQQNVQGVVGLRERGFMRHLRMWLIALAGAALLAVQSTPAAPAPLVSDFEDGLQGWELHGAATRVQTQILGGEWAIFGDGLVEGGAAISIQIDFREIGSITFDQFLVDGEGISVSVRQIVDLIENVFIPSIVIEWVDVSDAPLAAFIDNITFHPVPEAASVLLLGLGLIGLAAARTRSGSLQQ
jgi:hypothetical protein